MRRVVTITVLAALLAPATAPAYGPKMTLALVVANRVWGGPPPCGHITDVWSQDQIIEPDGALAAASALAATCTISFWAPVVSAYRDHAWVAFCTLVVHEVGHLHGLGHSPRPWSVMNASPLLHTFRPCIAEAKRSPYLRRTHANAYGVYPLL